MYKMCKLVGLSVCFILIVAILCTKLSTEQQLYRTSKLNAETAENRYKASRVEFINELYRFERYKVLFKDAQHKDDWEKEVEELKIINGFYDD